MTEILEGKRWKIICGNALDVMRDMEADSIDTIITDPPYGLFFMGKKWDYDVPTVELWQEVLRVLKPGGTTLIFAGSRTQHRMAINVEDAGFILKDCIMWLYGSGFPKSHDISRNIDKELDAEREVISEGKVSDTKKGKQRTMHKSDVGYNSEGFKAGFKDVPATPEAELWNGWKSHGLKPAYEPILVAMKPNDGTYAHNALKHGVSGLNIDGGKVGVEEITINRWDDGAKPFGGGAGHEYTSSKSEGRYPANVILDEDFIPILCLTNTKATGIIQVVEEYYYDYELPAVQQRVRCVSESSQKRSEEVLQQGVLPQSPIKKNGGKQSFYVRQKTQTRINRKNEASISETRKGQSNIQGGLHVEGLPIHQSSGTESDRACDGSQDDNERCYTRTPFSDGNEDWQTAKAIGASTPQERDQGRQQARESRSTNQLNSQEEPQTNIKGTSGITKRERRIEVLACDIPEKWMKYFEPTGDYIRNPECAAAMLDKQSGERPSGGSDLQNARKVGLYKDGLKKRKITPRHDTGGASRFFYCVKASQAERNAGCASLDKKRKAGAEFRPNHMKKAMEGKDGNPYGRWGKVQNNHPTVKPLALMEYLCTLTKTPTGGLVLDPFMGSGTTGVACLRTDRDFIGIEISSDYIKIAAARLRHTIIPSFTKLFT